MKKIITILILTLMCEAGLAQKVSLNPTISPSLFTANTQITVTYDVTGTSLASLSTAWIWVWIPGSNINAKYNVNPASADVTKTNNAKFIKSVENGKTLFKITFTPSAFFDGSITSQTQMGILLKGNDWSNGQTTDFVATIWDGTFQIKLNSPTQRPLFVDNGEQINITAETPAAADFDLYVNGVLITEQNSTSLFAHVHTVTETTGAATVKITATQGSNSSEISFQYIISTSSPLSARPAGIIAGINYHPDPTKATVCLWAPGKNSAYVIGDFTAWDVQPQYLMKRDGEYFWMELNGLTSGQQYAFQYLIDETIFIADPYSDMILDPDDQYIPESVYPGLKEFPAKALKEEWYFNRLSVLQTNQPSDAAAPPFIRPPKPQLVIYELLIRDFFENGERSYQNLIDTISYFKRLGVNAIQLMPIMEFNGNESWGYNPTFMFAPDKYYGPKDKLKEFVRVAHENGIAVILDIALNHQDIPNAFLMQDFNFATFRPNPTSKWFNVSATHPFSVFFDMNHESSYTKKYIDTINYYWLHEYKIDGFRFDLSKGFTQTLNPENVGAWSAYDPSRILLLKRMADKIWSHSPDAYIILEHLSENAEEKELSEYRAAEGKGMMLWGKMTDQYNQLTMGYEENASIAGIYHESRGWAHPMLIGYMESHDEERLMVKNILYGKESANYKVTDTLTALSRQLAANAVFYTLPGPKMLWQFGELGFDYSINYCEDGTIDDGCRISPKPVGWIYYNDESRSILLQHTSDIIHLRTAYDVFTNGKATIPNDNSLVKKIIIKNSPYTETPASPDEMNAVVVANFDVLSKEISVSFPHNGIWYDYYNGGNEVAVTGMTLTLPLTPGGYRIYTDYPIPPSVITSAEEDQLVNLLAVYPNPAQAFLTISHHEKGILAVNAVSINGSELPLKRMEDERWDVSSLNAGFYILSIQTRKGLIRKKFIKQ